MDMSEFKPNSNKYKREQKEKKEAAEKKRVEKVISGGVKTRKKSEVRKFTESIISDDAKNVKSYVREGVLIPAIKKAIVDIVTNGIDMLIYGERGRRGGGSLAERTSYGRFYDRRDEPRRTVDSIRSTSGYNYDDIVLESRAEAQEVLMRMDEVIETYKVASVLDLYDLVGLPTNPQDNKYGWTNLRNAKVVPVRDGFWIQLPKALPID